MRPAAALLVTVLTATLTASLRAEDAGVERQQGARESLKMSVDKGRVDLKQHRLEVVLNRDAATLTLKVVGDSGAVLAEQEIDLAGKPAGSPIAVTWSPSSEEAPAKIELRATDSLGYWSAVELTPWAVSIPHRDVLFKTGSSRIEDAEKPKLEESYAQIADAVARHADLGNVVLFVAGHTDTVGKAQDNLRLSRDRARAIAAWFRGRGLRVPIAYEGFGESALLVRTADEVDEPRNRRADYILSLDEPVIPASAFRPAWQRMR
ncbi:MAG TPA: OmpA family protein [Polyangiaceae bacterium]|nr:OmpA family protein [Polyangiaceae bacterium]